MIPVWAVKALLGVGLLVVVVLGIHAWSDSRYNAGHAAAVAERAKQDADKKAADTVTARADEKALRETQDAEQTARREKETQRETYIATLEGKLRSGAVSLSIATAAIHAGSPGGNSCGVAGPAQEERTNLMPETSVAILSIARDSANDVRDYNALMVEFERARALCNKR